MESTTFLTARRARVRPASPQVGGAFSSSMSRSGTPAVLPGVRMVSVDDSASADRRSGSVPWVASPSCHRTEVYRAASNGRRQPRLKTLRRKIGEAQGQVGQIAVRIKDDRRDALERQLFHEEHAEGRLARPGAGQDHDVAVEIGCFEEVGIAS